MKFFKKLGLANFLMLMLCLAILITSEYFFLTGEELHGIFLGLWVPTLLGLMIYLKLVSDGDK